jgi:hypothetical protein
MSEQQHPSFSSLPAIQALEERIRHEAPHLQVLDLLEFPRPFIEVKDTIHGIIVGFSSEADYITYCQVVNCRKGA